MKSKTNCCYFVSLALLITTQAWAQAQPAALFSTDNVLQLRFSGDVRALFNDRGDEPKYHPLALSYKNSDSSITTLNLKAKTRGHFRRDRSNCMYPPILLNFSSSNKQETAFKNQNKLKLVTSCRGDKYVIREYLVYKLYNLLTPKSFHAQLVQTVFTDSARNKDIAFYGILLEEVDQMAGRNALHTLEKERLPPQTTEVETFLKMAVFQYMIGNTDWSVEYLHNIKAIAFDSTTIPYVVPYDFDHAGIVDAPYAQPAAQLDLRSVQERRYRGYCTPNLSEFNDVLATFNRLKQEFYKIYMTCPLLDPKYIAATIKYLDEFYAVINTPKKWNDAFRYPCVNHKRNIVIGGLGTSDTDE